MTVVSHLPAEKITAAVLSIGDADLRLLTEWLTEAALEAD